jgi:hypothetical protein
VIGLFSITVAQGLAFCGAILGIVGAILGLLSFRRDRHKVVVALQWDAGQHYIGMRGNVVETWGHIYVTNTGRRPVFITFVGLDIPAQERTFNLLTGDHSRGVKLSEGDPPLIFKVPQDISLMLHANVWKGIRATITDSHNKTYRSNKVGECPSWAKDGYEETLAVMMKTRQRMTRQI